MRGGPVVPKWTLLLVEVNILFGILNIRFDCTSICFKKNSYSTISDIKDYSRISIN